MSSILLSEKLISAGKTYTNSGEEKFGHYSGVSALAGASYAIQKFDIGIRYAIFLTGFTAYNDFPMMSLQASIAYNLNKKL